MSRRELEFALAKQRLQMQCAAQRGAIADAATGLQPWFTAADSIHAGARWLRHHPELVAVAAVTIAVVRPGRTLRWAGRLLVAIRAWRSLRAWQPGLFGR